MMQMENQPKKSYFSSQSDKSFYAIAPFSFFMVWTAHIHSSQLNHDCYSPHCGLLFNWFNNNNGPDDGCLYIALILKSHSWLWMTISAFAFFNICFRGVIMILIPWLYRIHLHLDPFIYGLGVSCTAGGSFIAAIIFGSRSKWHHRGLLAYGGAIFGGISLLLMPFFTSVAMLSVLMAFQGFGIMIFSLIWETSLQELVPEEAFGRVVSLDILGSYMLLPFGYLLIGWLADQIGGTNTTLIFAGSCIMILASVLSIPSIRKFQ